MFEHREFGVTTVPLLFVIFAGVMQRILPLAPLTSTLAAVSFVAMVVGGLAVEAFVLGWTMARRSLVHFCVAAVISVVLLVLFNGQLRWVARPEFRGVVLSISMASFGLVWLGVATLAERDLSVSFSWLVGHRGDPSGTGGFRAGRRDTNRSPVDRTEVEDRSEEADWGGVAVSSGAAWGNVYQPVSLFEVRPGPLAPETVAEAEATVEAWASIDDVDGVPPVRGSGTDPVPWIVTGRIRTEPPTELGLDRAETVDVLEAVATILTAAHDRGVVHGSLRPETVSVARDGSVSVAGWGLLSTLSHLPESGLRRYNAPEQFRRGPDGPVDVRTDVFRFGALAYELLAGVPPYSGSDGAVVRTAIHGTPPPASSVAGDLPDAVDDVLERALAPDPADRYDAVADCWDDLATALASD